MTITLSTRIQKSVDQVSCDLNGEVAILNLKSALYFGLDPTGAIIWQALDRPMSVAELAGIVLDTFDVDEARCHADLIDLVARLKQAGLVEIVAAEG